MDIKKGEVSLRFQGIINIEELRNAVIKEVENYKDLAIDSKNIKEAKAVIDHLKPARTQVKNFRSEVNKELKARTKNKLDEIDNITGLISEVIDPLQANIDKYKEKKRLERIENKKAIWMPRINKINEDIEKAKYPPFFEKEYIEWNDKWANTSDQKLDIELELIVSGIMANLSQKWDRYNLVDTTADLFKNEYSLKADIDVEQLAESIYDEDWKGQLELIAERQQLLEAEVESKIEEEKEIAEHKQKPQEAHTEKLEDEANTLLTLVLELNTEQAKGLKKHLADNGIKIIKARKG